MLYCFNCNRTFESGKYCRYCGSLLKTKVINYETTSVLMRSNLSVRDIESPDMQSVLSHVQPDVPEYQPERRSDIPVPRQVDNFVRTMNTETVSRPAYTENEDSGFTNLSEISPDVIQNAENAPEEENSPAEGFTMESVVPAGEGADVGRHAEEKNKSSRIQPVKRITALPDDELVPENYLTDDSVEEIKLEEVSAELPESEEKPVQIAEAEPEKAVVEIPEPEEKPVVEQTIKTDISFDDFTNYMNTQEIEPVKAVEIEPEKAAVETPEPEEKPVVEQTIKNDISFDDFTNYMNTQEIEPVKAVETEPEEKTLIIENTVSENIPVKNEQSEINFTESTVPKMNETIREQPDTLPKPERSVAHNYSDIDPMFGPPPDMSFFSSQPIAKDSTKPSKEEKKRLKEERRRQKAEAKQQKKKMKKEK